MLESQVLLTCPFAAFAARTLLAPFALPVVQKPCWPLQELHQLAVRQLNVIVVAGLIARTRRCNSGFKGS